MRRHDYAGKRGGNVLSPCIHCGFPYGAALHHRQHVTDPVAWPRPHVPVGPSTGPCRACGRDAEDAVHQHPAG